MAKSIRNAVITGGASGIGLGIAKDLARRGMGVAIWARTGETVRAAANEINTSGGRAFGYEVDVANVTQVDDTARRSAADLGGITILVNSAGYGPFMPMAEHTDDVYDRVLGANLKGPFNCTRALAPGMVEVGWGRIIYISSLAAQLGAIQMTAYSAAKAALFGLTKAVAREFGLHGVTCNCLVPSVIDTPMLRENLEAGYMPLEVMEADAMVGRIGTVEEMAAACAYFISDEAGFVTGQIMSVNGGNYV